MARRPRASRLEHRSNRLKLPIRNRPYDWTALAPGIGLAYGRRKGAGSWVLRIADGRGGYATSTIGIADDYEDAGNGENGALDFWQAQRLALKLARGQDDTATGVAKAPPTFDSALDDYETELKATGRSPHNATRVRPHATPSLLAKPLELLTGDVLIHWRNRLIEDGLSRANITRTFKCAKAALALCARRDKRISVERQQEWRDALAALPPGDEDEDAPRAVPTDAEVVALIGAAHRLAPALGALVEMLACTGTRYSQAVKIKIADLDADDDEPSVFMPASRKGHRRKVLTGRAVPIPMSLAAKLKRMAGGRPVTERLLLMSAGTPWPLKTPNWSELHGPFATVAAEIGRPDITPYSLRHWSIIRDIVSGHSLQQIAEKHDTSPAIISRHYAREIAKRSSEAAKLARATLFDPAAQPAPQPATDNVVPYSRAG